MDDLSVGTAEDQIRTHLRERARAQLSGGFATPDWLEQSFVLPVQREELEPPAPMFVRPSTTQVDYALVVRRYDTCTRARFTTVGALVLALLSAIAFQLTGDVVLAYVGFGFALISVGAAVRRARLLRAPIPLRED